MIVQREAVSNASPFDLQMVCEHIRVTDVQSFAEVQMMALAAVREFEAYAQLALLDQTITVTIDERILRCLLPLPIAPLVDPLSVEVTVDGLPFDGFAVVAGLKPALRFTGQKPCGVVVISYLAGFGDAAADVPIDVKHAVADQVAAYFDMRGTGDGKTTGMSPHTARIAARYRRVSL